MIELPPFLLFYIAALVAAVLPRAPRLVLMLAVPLASCAMLLQLPTEFSVNLVLMDLQLEPLRVDLSLIHI